MLCWTATLSFIPECAGYTAIHGAERSSEDLTVDGWHVTHMNEWPERPFLTLTAFPFQVSQTCIDTADPVFPVLCLLIR